MAKKCDFPVVTIMLSFPFFGENICDANFFLEFIKRKKKGLGKFNVA
jgi:hypothetical protein